MLLVNYPNMINVEYCLEIDGNVNIPYRLQNEVKLALQINQGCYYREIKSLTSTTGQHIIKYNTEQMAPDFFQQGNFSHQNLCAISSN